MKTWIIIFVAFFFSFQALAQEDLDLNLDELEADFGEVEEVEDFAEFDEDSASFSEDETSTQEAETESIFSAMRISLDHAVSFRLAEPKKMINNRTGLNIDYAGSLADGLYAKMDLTGTLFWSKDHRAVSKNKDYGYDGLIREAWLQKSFDQLSFKAGLQSIVWGEVEGSQATDTLNPTDNSEFLFVDFEDARIGQATLQAMLYSSSMTLETFVTPQPKFNKNPEDDSIYSMTAALSAFEKVSAEDPESEYGIRSQFRWGTSEVSILGAKLVPNQPSYRLSNSKLEEVAKPYYLYGLNFNAPFGQTLLKMDMGYKTDQGVNDSQFALYFKDKLDTAIGLETTISRHSFNAMLSQSVIMDWNDSLTQEKVSGMYYMSWSKNYLNEDLSLNLGIMGVLARSDKITNGSAKYQFNDQLEFSMALFAFTITEQTSDFYAFRNEHRAEFKTKFQF